jgi:hypothetical protein
VSLLGAAPETRPWKPDNQTKTMSAVEVVLGTIIKFIAAMCVFKYLVSPMFGFDLPLSSNFAITAIFATNSIVISYFVRRLFNGL